MTDLVFVSKQTEPQLNHVYEEEKSRVLWIVNWKTQKSVIFIYNDKLLYEIGSLTRYKQKITKLIEVDLYQRVKLQPPIQFLLKY